MKKILFLTGTRADFGKLKSLIEILQNHNKFEVHIFATGMHMHKLYGNTVKEIEKCGYKNVFQFINFTSESSMDLTLAKTIEGLSSYIKENEFDLIVVHGDRVEALAGAIVGSLNNILVAHIEGGEVSGTIDELIRHAVTKMSHIHFVSNSEAQQRLIQLGERSDSIFVIGSPDMDLMFSEKLPELDVVLKYYNIDFKEYAIGMLHPVTTEYHLTEKNAEEFVDALIANNKNYIIIYPNNDLGSKLILDKYKKLSQNPRFKLFPSIRFEYFLVLLKNAEFIIGNSSAGIREAPAYGVPTINIGSRQQNRSFANSIIHCSNESNAIIKAINQVPLQKRKKALDFGDGASDKAFLNILESDTIWKTSTQKVFIDICQ